MPLTLNFIRPICCSGRNGRSEISTVTFCDRTEASEPDSAEFIKSIIHSCRDEAGNKLTAEQLSGYALTEGIRDVVRPIFQGRTA